ncbi:MAG: hypothetical protein KDA60_20195 [Planctomycetales bacterium]|nr:hypothetical protein [Planctomycetales bacterium]
MFTGSVPLNGGPAHDVPTNVEGLAFTADGVRMFTVADDETVDYVSYHTADMDHDGDVDAADIDTSFDAINNTISDEDVHDVDRDGDVDITDAYQLIYLLLDTAYGDFDLDGDVDDDDYDILDAHYYQSVDSWAEGDTNGSGFVDFTDFVNWNNNYGFGT